MGFQTRFNQYNPIGVEGDFASANVRTSAYAGAGALIAGPEGVTVGRFAWIDADGRTVHNYGDGASAPDGYVPRTQSAFIANLSQEASNVIPAGFPVTLLTEGDFLIQARGNAATKNAAVYASYADGTPNIGAAPAGASATGSIGSTSTATGSVVGDVNELTVTAVTGLISVDDAVAGAGVPAGTVITGQISGTPGGAGVYSTNNPTTIAGTTATTFGNVLNVTAVGSGTLKVGDAITGTGVPAGATLASQVSGAIGGVGVYTLQEDAAAYAASTALTVVGGIVTKFAVRSAAAVGELAAMSSW